MKNNILGVLQLTNAMDPNPKDDVNNKIITYSERGQNVADTLIASFSLLISFLASWTSLINSIFILNMLVQALVLSN